MSQTIFTGFSPNTTMKDVRIALSFLVLPWKWGGWKNGIHLHNAEEMLCAYFDGRPVKLFDSGRSALLIALRALGVGTGDEVLVQAFTCVVVVNAIKWVGASPVYVDIQKETLNMDVADAKKKITTKTKAIIIQHTFGLPANIDVLLSFARAHNLRTIEDCAHSLGARYEGTLTGTFADIGMLSFGGEKIISCVRGGALIVNNQAFLPAVITMKKQLPNMSTKRIFQHLVHVVVFPLGKRWYHIFFGKLFLYCIKKLHLANKIITNNEKKGIYDSGYPATLPHALATLLVSQIPYIDERNRHRKMIANMYTRMLEGSGFELQAYSPEHIYLRYTVFVRAPETIRKKTKELGILLGDWYSTVVGPRDTDVENTGYIVGSCPVAEERSNMVLNLPTGIHTTKKDVEKIITSITE